MKLKGNTWLLIFLAVSLGSWVYFYEIRGAEKRSQIKAGQQKLFDFSEETIQKITIAKSAEILEFVRTDNKNQPWQMKQPEDVLASDASIAFLLDLVVKGKSDRSFTVPVSKLYQYGLDKTATKITIELSNQETHAIVLGNSNLGDILIYAQVYSSKNKQETTQEETQIMLVPKNWHHAVNRELSEWKQSQ